LIYLQHSYIKTGFIRIKEVLTVLESSKLYLLNYLRKNHLLKTSEMKKKSLFRITRIIVLIIGCYLTLKATAANYVRLDEIVIKRANSSNTIKIGCSKSKLIQSFRKPSKDLKFYFEMDEKNGYEVSYHHDKFYFLADKLIGFEIVSPNFIIKFRNSGTSMFIGSKTNKFSPGYHYKNHSKTYDLKSPDGSPIDQFLEFDLDNRNRKIIKIIYGDY